MLAQDQVQKELSAYVCVEWMYDGLGGSVISWTREHGNTNDDPSILSWILDPAGEEVARPGSALSSPGGFSDWLREHSSSSFPLVDVESYEHLQGEARSIASRRKLGSTVAGLRDLLETGAEGEEEAQRLLDAILPYAEWKLERASALEKINPPAALATYKEVASEFKGDQLGDRASETLKRLQKDKAFGAEQKAFLMLEQVRQLAEELRPCKARNPLDLAGCAECQRKNKAPFRRAQGLLEVVRRRYPDTAGAARAADQLRAWGLLEGE